MSDDSRPSITHLQQRGPEPCSTSEQMQALPALLEIAAAALERQQAVQTEDWEVCTGATQRLDRALVQVRR